MWHCTFNLSVYLVIKGFICAYTVCQPVTSNVTFGSPRVQHGPYFMQIKNEIPLIVIPSIVLMVQ